MSKTFIQVELGKEPVAVVVKTEESQKKWSLEEEDSDEEQPAASELAIKVEKVKEEVVKVVVKEVPLPPVKKVEEDEDLDPLDAYMTEVSKEVRKIKGASFKAAKGLVTAKVQPKDEKANGVNGGEAAAEKKKGVFVMMGVAKKKPELHIKKPEVRLH